MLCVREELEGDLPGIESLGAGEQHTLRSLQHELLVLRHGLEKELAEGALAGLLHSGCAVDVGEHAVLERLQHVPIYEDRNLHAGGDTT